MIYPMFAMFLLTPIVGVLVVRSRVRAVRSRDVHFKYFRTMSGEGALPDYVALPGRHFINLFELPILFYVACLAAMIMQVNGPLMTGLAWAFVGARYVQAVIHLTYNNVLHRMSAFIAGLVIVTAMWVLLVVWAT